MSELVTTLNLILHAVSAVLKVTSGQGWHSASSPSSNAPVPAGQSPWAPQVLLPAPWPLSWDHIYISHPSNSKVQSGSGGGGCQDALASFPTGWYPRHTGRSVFEYHPGFWAEDYPLSCWANWQSFRLFSDPQTQGLFLGSCCALGSGRLRPTRKGVKSYLWLNIYHVPEAYSVH